VNPSYPVDLEYSFLLSQIRAARKGFEALELSVTTVSNRVDTLRVVHLDEMEGIREAVNEVRCRCGEVEVEAGSLSPREGSLPVSEYSVGAVRSEVATGSGSGQLTLIQEEEGSGEDEADAVLAQDEEEARAEASRILDFQASEVEDEAIAYCIAHPIRMPTPDSPPFILGTPSPSSSDLEEERALKAQ